MKGTFGSLNTIVRGLYAQQASLDTVGHNVSNTNTDGYSRQRVNLITAPSETIYGANGAMQVGTGVNVQSVTRLRDSFIDQQYWKENSSLSYQQSMSDSLSKIQGVFHEPSNTGVQTVLNNFWTAWNKLSSSTGAADPGVRATVRQRGQDVVDTIQHAAQQLKDMVTDINSNIDIKVNKINQIDAEISSLNQQIVNIETGGTDHANDLRDRRDYLVDQLSSIINVTVSEKSDGSYIVQTSGTTLVSENSYQSLKTYKTQDPAYGYEVNQVVLDTPGTPMQLSFRDGELKGLIDSRDDSVTGAKAYLNKLSAISQFLLKDFNEVHRSGLGLDNSTQIDFFGNPSDTFTDSSGTIYTDPGAPASSGGWPATWPSPSYNTPTAGDWISALKINPILYDTATGLDKIAAKTYIGAITQSNSTAGAATASATGTYTGTDAFKNVVVKVSSVDGNSDVTNIQISMDGGTTWSANIAASGIAPNLSFQVPAATTGIGLAFNLTFKRSTGTAAGDTYSFSVPQGSAAGDNATLLCNRLKTDAVATLGNTSLDSYYNAMTGTMGVQAENAQRMTDNQTTLVSQITNWRESVSGVSMDEEMTNMIRFQKGYSAAARLVTALDEMLDKLINNTGVVGR